MLRDVGAVTVTCLQLLLLAGGAQPRPRAWDEDGQQLEAIKHGILRRLGMAGPPPVPHAPDPESISRARRLYERRVAELRGNRSREREERDGAAAATRWHRLTAIRKWTLRSRRVPGPRPPAAPQPHPCGACRTPPGESGTPKGGRNDPEDTGTPTESRIPTATSTPTGSETPKVTGTPADAGTPPGPYRYLLLVPRTGALRQRPQVLRARLPLPPHSAPLRVSIYTPGGSGGAPRLLQGRDLDPRSLHLDLTSLIRHWAAGSSAALRLELTFSSDASAPWDGTGTGNAVLEVETWDGEGRGARRRRGLEEECGKSEGKCCRRVLKVSFQEIGWDDWVLAPRSYDMRFCQGSCPHNYRAASMHAQIQARVHALSRAAPAPCCVPAAYDPMVLMHYDGEGRLVSSVFEDMLVTRCHCA
ncbi:embryonic growth/differentiation factor 1-like [Lagopus leucura]|uniref:embryonic growth/differentiation factor 1-like n=1 Tax=Lagopus leucura TaxID=30410 RepID=UPI001C67950F|nr:embryonic growth/differentiation factor 1-like [Lagopus leucura]